MLKVKEVKSYETSDGKLFNSLNEAEKHEGFLNLLNKIQNQDEELFRKVFESLKDNYWSLDHKRIKYILSECLEYVSEFHNYPLSYFESSDDDYYYGFLNKEVGTFFLNCYNRFLFENHFIVFSDLIKVINKKTTEVTKKTSNSSLFINYKNFTENILEQLHSLDEDKEKEHFLDGVESTLMFLANN